MPSFFLCYNTLKSYLGGAKMSLEEAVKKVFERGFNDIKSYTLDGEFINLSCKNESGNIFPARIIFNGTKYHTDSVYNLDEIEILAREIQKNL